MVFGGAKRETRNPGTAQNRIANSDGQTDGLTDWRINIQADIFYDIQKEPLTIFSKIRQTEKGRFGFSTIFHHLRWNSKQNGNDQIFFNINSNCVISKTIWKKRCSQMQLGQLIMYYTPKKVLPFAFFNLPGLQQLGRNLFSDKSCWVI